MRRHIGIVAALALLMTLPPQFVLSEDMVPVQILTADSQNEAEQAEMQRRVNHSFILSRQSLILAQSFACSSIPFIPSGSLRRLRFNVPIAPQCASAKT